MAGATSGLLPAHLLPGTGEPPPCWAGPITGGGGLHLPYWLEARTTSEVPILKPSCWGQPESSDRSPGPAVTPAVSSPRATHLGPALAPDPAPSHLTSSLPALTVGTQGSAGSSASCSSGSRVSRDPNTWLPGGAAPCAGNGSGTAGDWHVPPPGMAAGGREGEGEEEGGRRRERGASGGIWGWAGPQAPPSPPGHPPRALRRRRQGTGKASPGRKSPGRQGRRIP